MKLDICRTCEHHAWMVGIGLGVRCRHEGNSEYKQEKTTQKISVLISHIPDGCTYYNLKGK